MLNNQLPSAVSTSLEWHSDFNPRAPVGARPRCHEPFCHGW